MLVAENEVTDDGQPGVLACPVTRPRRVALQHARGHGIERLESTRHSACWEGLYDESAI